jgi:hypothetical protein
LNYHNTHKASQQHTKPLFLLESNTNTKKSKPSKPFQQAKSISLFFFKLKLQQPASSSFNNPSSFQSYQTEANRILNRKKEGEGLCGESSKQ